jgi:hypothetical protein
MFEISGYALIYKELHTDDTMWNVVINEWSKVSTLKVFAKYNSTQEVLHMMIDIISHKGIWGGHTPMKGLSFEQSKMITQDLEKHGIIADRYQSPLFTNEYSRKYQSSILEYISLRHNKGSISRNIKELDVIFLGYILEELPNKESNLMRDIKRFKEAFKQIEDDKQS